MAIVYSYPGATPTLSDTVLGTKFDYNGNPTKSFLISDIIDLVPIPTLNVVLNAGNTSLLDAKIGELYLYDNPNSNYAKISIQDDLFSVIRANSGTVIFAVDNGNYITLNNGTASAQIINSLTTSRTYTLPNATGTFALTSDIPSVSGTTNYLPKFTGASALNNSQIYQDGTNISIGGTTASTKVDVQGNIFTRNTLYFGQLAGSAIPDWNLGVDGSGNLVLDDTYQTKNFTISSAGNVFINNSGQVMIGTTLTGTPYYGALPQLTVAANTGGVLDIRTNEANVVANTLLGRIQFSGKDDAPVGYTSAAIEVISFTSPSSVSNGGGILKLMTSASGYGTNPTERMRITQDGIVQPGLDNAYSLGASGIRWSAVWAANGTIQTSDEREKKNIVDADLGLDFVSKLRPVSFKWKVGKNEVTSELDGVDEEGNPLLDEEGNIKSKTIVTPIEGKRTHYGLIAQEVETLLDGKDFGGFIHDKKTDIKGLRYDQFIPILINAIKELNEKIKILENK